MKHSLLQIDEVLAGYDVVCPLYPYVPPINLWRAWECAAYARYTLPEPVLDVGCGDGRFFRLVWPGVREAVGIDHDPATAEAARRSGVYSEVHAAPAHRLPVADGRFAAAFANCSMEHMEQLPEVLAEVRRCLQPEGVFLLSVVTDNFVNWATLPLLAEGFGDAAKALALQADYESYHHLVNPLPSDTWIARLEEAGFEVLEHTPIVPELTSRLFLLLDHMWHVKSASGEMGEGIGAYLRTLPEFPQRFRPLYEAVMAMERDWATCSGAVFRARRRA